MKICLPKLPGIPDYLNFEFNLPNPFRIDIPVKQIIDSIKPQPLQFTPSSKFEYSNSNYFLLGYIIEQVSGLPYSEYLQKNIFTPAGLTNTHYETPSAIIPNRVTGYEKSKSNYENSDYISISAFYSAGGLIANTTDLFKWNQALLDGKIVKKELLDKAFQPFKLSDGKQSEYGYGWYIRTLEGSKTIEHGGSIFGFRAEEIFLPDENIYVAGLFNCRQQNNDQQTLCYDIAKLALGKSIAAEIKLSDEILDRYIGTYKLSTDTGRTVTIFNRDNQLVGQLSEKEVLPLIFNSETKFQFKNVANAQGEFIIENDKVIKFNVSQNGHYEWIKSQ